MTYPLLSGELGSWQGIRVVDRDHFCPSWRRPLAWLAHRYRWPIGCDPLDLLCDDLEDPSYDRLYDTLLPDDYEKPSDVIRRWASKIWAGLGQDVYFGKFADLPGRRPRPQPTDLEHVLPGFEMTARFPLEFQGDTITFNRIQNLETP